MKQYGMQRRVPEPSKMPHVVCYLGYCRILTYATPSLLHVLLLLFLEKLDRHFDEFYREPKLLGPDWQHPRFVVVELWANKDM